MVIRCSTICRLGRTTKAAAEGKDAAANSSQVSRIALEESFPCRGNERGSRITKGRERRVEDLKPHSSVGTWGWPAGRPRQRLTCIRAEPDVVLTWYFYFAVDHGVVATALGANVSAVTCSPVAAGRRVKLLTNDSVVVWGSSRAC
jgi:hypothetical protein